jgi:3-hydroxymyristoyl/3-hydroxydecanoyl-(acyl carrier protein) dehydratase
MPRDPWFTRANGSPVTPYSILMEIALQPCGFLSAHQGTSFVYADSDLYVRNLDGSGFLHREIDLRGRTLRNRVVLTSTTSLSGVILQKFTYTVECEGEAVFDGDAAFGYFEAAALGQQAGLDGGRSVPTWLAASGVPAGWVELGDGQRLADARPGRPHERLPTSRLHLLDRAAVIPGGGRHGLGYVLAEKAVDPSSWFFACHFHQDPVMPGSLGVESIVEALQYLIMSMGLTEGFRSPRFGHLSGGRTVWKYRGQVLADARSIAVEVHITGVEERDDAQVVTAEASLWRDGLRIYALNDLAQCVSEAGNERPRLLVERVGGEGHR